MILHLNEGKNVSVNAHSEFVWLSSFNGCGTVVPLTPDQAMELGLAMFRMARQMKKVAGRA